MPQDERDDLEGNLSQVSDEDWKAAHEALQQSDTGGIPEKQLSYIWAPEMDPTELYGGPNDPATYEEVHFSDDLEKEVPNG